MSSSSAYLPTAWRARSRVSSWSRAALAHDRWLAAAIALAVAVVAFEPRIKGGGFNADDWPLYAAFRFPQATGYHTSLGALQPAAGSRLGHMLYWFVSFTLFGTHTRLYSAAAGMLAVAMGLAFYLALRELRFSIAQSLAMMLLSLIAPSVSAVRFWFTPGGVQIALALFFLGLTLALRAFAATPEKRFRLHLASLALYASSALYVETALPLMAIAVLVYLTRASWRASLRRWTIDLAIVAAGYGGTLVFVSTRSGFEKIPVASWGEHARLMAEQSVTLFTRELGPLAAHSRTLGVLGLVALLAATVTLLRRGELTPAGRRELRRWAVAFLISAAAFVASFAVYVPAMLYYEPLDPGLATHIDSVVAAPLAVAVVATLMLTRAVCIELMSGLSPHVPRALTAIVLAWFVAIGVYAVKGVRSDGRIWAQASERGAHVLHVLAADLPNPVQGATIYTFGESGTIAVGMPIFFTSWEQTNAVKISYDRPDLSSYPIVDDGMQVACEATGVRVVVGTQVINSPSPYGAAYFFDVRNGQYELIDSERACAAALARFPSGPYADPQSREWAL